MTRTDVADGQPGEMLIRHSVATPRRGFFSGYLNDDAATGTAWRGGWFHTGDTVYRKADGMLHFVDRKKNIIRRSGENIAAAEIEAVLLTHRDVQQAAVMAVKDELREEEVLACVVLKRPTARRGGGCRRCSSTASSGSPTTRRRAGCTSWTACRPRALRKYRSTPSIPAASIREPLPASSTSATASAARRSSGRPGTLPFIPAVAKRRVGPGTVAPWPWVRDGRSAASGMTGRANKRRLRLVNAVRRQSR